MTLHLKYFDAMKAHCKGRFPRELGVPFRFNYFSKDIIKNNNDLYASVDKWNNERQKNTYVSVYSFREIRNDSDNIELFNVLKEEGMSRHDIFKQYKHDFVDIVNRDSAVFDTYYLDFDDEIDPLNAIIEARNTTFILENDFGIKTRMYWSGKKGIAMYIDFEPYDINSENIKPVVSYFNEYIKNKCNAVSKKIDDPLVTLDVATKDGQSRISKLPNTLHKSSGLYCIPMNKDDLWNTSPLEHIREIAKKPRDDIDLGMIIKENEKNNTEIMHAMTKRIEEGVMLRRKADAYAKKTINACKPIWNNTDEWNKCYGVIHAEDNGQNHPGREPTASGLIIAYKKWGKYDIEKTREIMKFWAENKCTPPEDVSIVEERINKFYSKETTYAPCTLLQKYGHCDGSRCSIMKNKK